MRSKNIHFVTGMKLSIAFVFAFILLFTPKVFSQNSSKLISIKLLHSFENTDILPYKAKFSVDGNYLICESFKGSFDPKTGKLQIQGDMDYLIYDVRNSQIVRSLLDTKTLGFNYKNDYLIEKDGIVLCSLSNGREIAKISETPGAVVISYDTKSAAIILSNEKILIYDFIADKKEEFSISNFNKDTGRIYLFENKTLLQLLKNNDGLILKDIINDKVLNTFPCNNKNLTNIAYAPNGISVAACSVDSIYIWKILDKNSLIVRPFPHEKGFNAFNFSREGMLIGAGSASMDLLFYNRMNDEIIVNLNSHTGPITDLVFSPIDDEVVTTSFDGTLKVWMIDRK